MVDYPAHFGAQVLKVLDDFALRLQMHELREHLSREVGAGEVPQRADTAEPFLLHQGVLEGRVRAARGLPHLLDERERGCRVAKLRIHRRLANVSLAVAELLAAGVAKPFRALVRLLAAAFVLRGLKSAVIKLIRRASGRVVTSFAALD